MDNAHILSRIKTRFPAAVLEEKESCGDLHITVEKESFPDLMRFLRDDDQLSFTLLSDIAGVDYNSRTPRFALVYILFSCNENHRLQVIRNVEDGEEIPSVSAIWKSADWAEREIFDLLGIVFSDHPDLRRILTWDNFEGHPLRKDYPLLGKDFDTTFDPDTIIVDKV